MTGGARGVRDYSRETLWLLIGKAAYINMKQVNQLTMQHCQIDVVAHLCVLKSILLRRSLWGLM